MACWHCQLLAMQWRSSTGYFDFSDFLRWKIRPAPSLVIRLGCADLSSCTSRAAQIGDSSFTDAFATQSCTASSVALDQILWGPWKMVQGDVDLYIDGRSELCPFERFGLPSLVWKPYLYNSCLRGCRIDHKNSKFNRWYTNPLSRGYRRNMEKQPQVYRHINPCWCPPALTLIGKAVVIGVLQDPEVLRMTSGDLLQEVSMQSLS